MADDEPMGTPEETEATAEATVQRFAALVLKNRKKRGWSRSVLGETAGVSEDVIYRLETCRSDPPLSLVGQLTRVLALPIDSAIFKSTNNNVQPEESC